MEREELKATLSQLHQQLQSGQPVDPEIASLIQQLSVDVNQLAASSTPGQGQASPAAISESRQSLIDQMLDLTSDFEKTHPQLAEAIGRVATALSRIGI